MFKRASIAAIAIALSALFAAPVAAEKWPAPKASWWKSVKRGSSATYVVTMGTMTTRLVMTVDKVKGSEITISTRTFMGTEDLGVQAVTVDAKTNPLGGAPLPAGLDLQRGRTTTIKVGDEAFIATIYEIESTAVKATVWHSNALPPIFAGGAVKLELDGELKTTMTLVAYDPR